MVDNPRKLFMKEVSPRTLEPRLEPWHMMVVENK
jgi:hypothetical protein